VSNSSTCADEPQFGHLTILFLSFFYDFNIRYFIHDSKFAIAQATHKIVFVFATMIITARPHESDTITLVAVGTDKTVVFIKPSH
jgi:hypothetical protein